MNIQTGFISQLEELVFQQNQLADRSLQLLSSLKQWVVDLATGFGIPVAVGACCLIILVLVYRPRMNRGSIWLPGFGLFGGTPTLYLHTRPASLCGLFSPVKRLRHRRRGCHGSIRQLA